MIVVNATARKWAEEELARYREHLEELVDERTAEVVAVNQQLQQDIIERKRAEAEKEKLEEQLRQSQKMEAIGRLAGGIAHDFNNILTGIIGYTEMILQSIGPVDPLYPDLEEVKRAAERAATLTSQLLAFSRKQIIQPVRIDLGEVVAQSKNMLARIIGEDIVLYFKRQEKLWSIHADPNQMEQVLINLAVNARDAMPGGGRLSITLTNVVRTEPLVHRDEEIPVGEYVQLSVTDTGSGMDPEIMEHIFEPFFSTKTKDKGTGLGLATVYGIVKQNQGYIIVESENGKGSTFSIYLPRKVESEQPVESPQQPAKEPGETVLLIADEELVLNLARRILEAEGYFVLFAEDGYEAIQVCKERNGDISLMVADADLNQGQGNTIYDQIKKLNPTLKTIFLTEMDETEHPEEERFYIRKPFSIESFTQKVQQVMKG
jgi:signal transduction histidine kinase